MTGSESKDEPDTHEPRERVDEAVLEDEGERIEESSEKMRQSARRNRGSGRDTVTERGNVQ